MEGGAPGPQVPRGRGAGAGGRTLCEEAVTQARRAVAEVEALARGLEEARGDSRTARAQLGVTQGNLEDERFSRGRAEGEARAGREARERLRRELEACAVRERGLRDVAENYVEVKRVAASSVERVEGLEAHLRAALQRGAQQLRMGPGPHRRSLRTRWSTTGECSRRRPAAPGMWGGSGTTSRSSSSQR